MVESLSKGIPVFIFLFFYSEPIIEEGDVEAEYNNSKEGKSMCLMMSLGCGGVFEKNASQCDVLTEVEADSSTRSFAAPTQKKTERPRANSSGSIDQNKFIGGPAGGGVTSGGKLLLQIPVGPQCKPKRVHSPGNVRRE